MSKIIEKLKSLSAGTVVRTLLQILVYANQFVILIGQSPFGESSVYVWVSFIITILITGLTYWYNNDWSEAAQTADDVYDIIKDGKVTPEEVEEFVEKYKQEKDEG